MMRTKQKTQKNLTPFPLPQIKPKEKKKKLSLSEPSHWLHGNSIPNIGCHYFWPGLIIIAFLPKNTHPTY
jgi:hypothetical protein